MKNALLAPRQGNAFPVFYLTTFVQDSLLITLALPPFFMEKNVYIHVFRDRRRLFLFVPEEILWTYADEFCV